MAMEMGHPTIFGGLPDFHKSKVLKNTEDCLEGMLGLLGTPFKMKRAPMDKNCLSNFPKVIFQPAFLWDMWVNCCLTAQAGGVDPFAVGIQPWLREPRWWWWFGMGKSDSDVFFFSQQKRFFYDGGLGIFTFWNLGDLLWRDHPTSWLPRKSLRFFFIAFSFHCILLKLSNCILLYMT